MRFISTNQDNDVSLRVFGLISEIPDEKRIPMIETCNKLSHEIRFVKFCLDSDNYVNLEYDFLIEIPDDYIRVCCFKLFARIMQILNEKYHELDNM